MIYITEFAFLQDDQKVCMHLTITVQKNTKKQRYFKHFQSSTMIT